jgi:hypothetical protein
MTANHPPASQPPQPPQQNPQRRRDSRQPLDAPASFFADADTALANPIAARIFNISTVGIGFWTRQPAAVNSFHRIRIESGDKPAARRLRITRCHKRGEGFDIGGVFTD